MVAEKNSVWRAAGRTARIRSMSGKKAHVEHAVGFVEDEDLHAAQVDEPALDEIVQTAGGGDDHLGALAECLQLRVLAQTADHDGGASRCPRPFFERSRGSGSRVRAWGSE